MTQFRETLPQQVQAFVPADHDQPIRLWASDESRFGLHTIRRRRITARGIKPLGRHQHRFENLWIFGAVEPSTGAGHFMEFRQLNTVAMQQFLDDFARTYPESLNIIVLDNAASHRAKTLRIPDNVRLLFQPPYAPEVNPCERVWQHLKAAIAWELFADLDQLRYRVCDIVTAWTDQQLQSLTSYPFFTAAANATSL